MINNQLKIIFILVLSFVVSFIINKTVFLSNTPRINPKFARSIKNLPTTSKAFFAQLNQFFTPKNINNTNSEKFFSELPKVNVPKSINYKLVSKGVYAAEDKKSNIKYLKIEKGTQIEVREYRIKLKNGQDKIIKVLVPIN
jgi:hypothetical protein